MSAGTVEIGEALWGEAEPKRSAVSISAAIESLAYGALEQTHSGWENNDGAYEDIIFDIAERSLTLDYNERYTASEHFTTASEEVAMGHCYHHALSSVRKWGGITDDYLPLHRWFD